MAAPSPDAPVSRAYANYVLGLLFVVYIFNFIDRQILSILIEPVKQELGVSDTAMGFLTGLAFALFYTFAGIPIAHYADRGVRRTVIAVGLAAWSLMTALSGLVTSFSQLALARVGVGVGEAACAPPSHSLLSDYFAPARRGTALAIHAMGIHAGVLLGFMLGGWFSQSLGWRSAFLLVGLPGLALALLVRLTVRELPRRPDGPALVSSEAPALSSVLRYLWQIPTFRHMALGAALTSFTGYSMMTWSAPFLMRIHGLESGEVGLWLGLIAGLGGAAGTLLGGALSDRLGRRDRRWYLWLPGLASGAVIPFALLYLLLPDTALALAALLPVFALGPLWLGPVFATAQSLAPPHMRAVASAMLLFVVNLIGLGLGPFLIGLFADLLAPAFGTEALRYALCLVVLSSSWSALHFTLAARSATQ